MSLIKEKICHYLPGDIGGGGIMKNVTNSDMGAGGSKMWEFCDDIIFEWHIFLIKSLCQQI